MRDVAPRSDAAEEVTYGLKLSVIALCGLDSIVSTAVARALPDAAEAPNARTQASAAAARVVRATPSFLLFVDPVICAPTFPVENVENGGPGPARPAPPAVREGRQPPHPPHRRSESVQGPMASALAFGMPAASTSCA